jgi:hypothetical protein
VYFMYLYNAGNGSWLALCLDLFVKGDGFDPWPATGIRKGNPLILVRVSPSSIFHFRRYNLDT